MKENFDVFDFKLSPEELTALSALDKPVQFAFSHRDPELVRFLLNYDKVNNPANR